MIDITALEKMNPQDRYDPYKKEPFDVFYKKVHRLLPNLPADVLEQWAYRHFSCFMSLFDRGMQIDNFDFSIEKWNIDRILQIQDADDFYGHGIGKEIVTNPFSWLMNDMRKHGTWPKAIIVYDTLESRNNGRFPYQKPYHLIEGHRRLLYLRRMYDAEMPINTKHAVWRVTQKRN